MGRQDRRSVNTLKDFAVVEEHEAGDLDCAEEDLVAMEPVP